jgi:putative multiple sugar transport system ATP-binding protein
MTVRHGEVHAICGENGAGKVDLDEGPVGSPPRRQLRRRDPVRGKLCEFRNSRDSEHAGIVFIHQELALIPELSIAENTVLGNEAAPGPDPGAAHKVS